MCLWLHFAHHIAMLMLLLWSWPSSCRWLGAWPVQLDFTWRPLCCWFDGSLGGACWVSWRGTQSLTLGEDRWSVSICLCCSPLVPQIHQQVRCFQETTLADVFKWEVRTHCPLRPLHVQSKAMCEKKSHIEELEVLFFICTLEDIKTLISALTICFGLKQTSVHR